MKKERRNHAGWLYRTVLAAMGGVAFGLAGVVLPAAAQVPDVMVRDATSGNLVQIYGPREGAHYGNFFAAGDLDGDGVDDLVIGDPYAKGLDDHSGTVYVLFAPAGGWPATIDISASPAIHNVSMVRLLGRHENDGFGNTVLIAPAASRVGEATAGDLLVSARLAEAPLTDAGEVYVFRSDTLVRAARKGRTLIGDTDADVRIQGGGKGDKLGVQLAVGDFGNDGTPEIMITAPLGEKRDDATRLHRAYLVTGGPALLDPAGSQRRFSVRAADNPATPEIDGHALVFRNLDTGNRFTLNNEGVAFADIDGDGLDDLLLANPFWDDLNGRVFAIQASVPRVPGTEIDLSLAPSEAPDTPDFRIDQTRDSYSMFGSALAAANVVGDLHLDLVVGAVNFDDRRNNRNQAGVLFILPGPLSPATRTIRLNDADFTPRTALITGKSRADNLGNTLAVLPPVGSATYANLAGGMPRYWVKRYDTRNGGTAFLRGGLDALLGRDTVVDDTRATELIVAGDRKEDWFGIGAQPTRTRVAASSDETTVGVWVGAWSADPPPGKGAGILYLFQSPFHNAGSGELPAFPLELFHLARAWQPVAAGARASTETGTPAGPGELLRLIAERRR